MQEVQIVDHGGAERFGRGTGEGGDDVGPEEGLEGLGECAPEVGEAEEEGGEEEDGAFAVIVCEGNPEEVEEAEDEDGPEEEGCYGGLGFVEFDGEDVWGGLLARMFPLEGVRSVGEWEGGSIAQAICGWMTRDV